MVDIIIPVYNSVNTLARTLSSIVSQVNVPEIEVYIVDDCSTENYDFIINSFNKLLNIHYIKLKKNSGPGYAREYGLNISKGEYVIFLDSDDIFASPLSINILYNEIQNTKYDVVRTVIAAERDDEILIYKNENIGLHGKIYRRKFIKNKDIHFNTSRSNEDAGFNALLKLYGANYKDIDELTYFWCNNKQSITRKNEEDYKKTDIEFFSYNMYWAIDNADRNGCSEINIKIVSIEALFQIYDRIMGYEDKYVSKKTQDYLKKICNISNKYNTLEEIEEIVINYDLIDNFSQVKESFYEFIESISGKKLFKKEKKNMTQKERKEKGLIFDYVEEEFGEDKRDYVDLINEYNTISQYDVIRKKELLKEIFGSVGEYCTIEPPIFTNCGGKNVYIGEDAYINFNLSLVDDGNIYIGDSALIGPNVTIITTNHPINIDLRLRKSLYVKDVHIGNNVWIGAGSIILPGVTIGDNAVIGAGSVVTKDIPANVIAVGNPCKVMREINEKDDVFFYKKEKIDWENI